MNRYRIAELSVMIEDGEFKGYTISRAGKQVGQGSFEFGYGSESYSNLEDALLALETHLTRDEDNLIDYAKNK